MPIVGLTPTPIHTLFEGLGRENGAAGILGLNASTLRARMRNYGIIRQ
jgi:DNA-binding protein Fis